MESNVDTACLLMLLSHHDHHQQGVVGNAQHGARKAALARARRVFECKTCSRRFPTFQALGGHRASHRRPARVAGDVIGAGRLCRPGLQPLEAHGGAGRARVHRCPVCGVKLAVGQVLGGHMRRHCATAHADADAHGVVEADDGGDERAGGICLDLSLAPSENCAKCRP